MAKPSKDRKPIADLFNILSGDNTGPVLHYTPKKGEPIEISAPIVVAKMLEENMDADIHFKTFTLEVERDQSAEFIIEAYYGALDIVKDMRAAQRKANKGPKK